MNLRQVEETSSRSSLYSSIRGAPLFAKIGMAAAVIAGIAIGHYAWSTLTAANDYLKIKPQTLEGRVFDESYTPRVSGYSYSETAKYSFSINGGKTVVRVNPTSNIGLEDVNSKILPGSNVTVQARNIGLGIYVAFANEVEVK